MAKYSAKVEEQMAIHCLEHRLDVCSEALQVYPGDPDLVAEIEHIYVQFKDIQINAEKKCRKIYCPALPFSEPVKLWDFRKKCYQGLLCRLQGQCASLNNILCQATAARIPNPKTLMALQCNDGIRYCKLCIIELRKSSKGLHRVHNCNCLI